MASGSLSIFLGPMYSGKTTKLIDIYNNYTKKGTNVLAINYFKDTRYTTEPFLISHDKNSIPCLLVSKLSEAYCADETNADNRDRFMNAKVILINECQFFPDIVEWVKMAVTMYKKKVYICGLDGDFKRRPFGNWLDLISFCDSITKLYSECKVCKQNDAIFSHRLSNEKEQIVIGNQYVPLCRECYDIIN
jgi:thymidine kinase